MATITGVTTERPRSVGRQHRDGDWIPYITIRFSAYRVDSGPVVDEALSVTRFFPDGLPSYSTDVPTERVLRLVCELVGAEWTWTKNSGVIKTDPGLNKRVEALTRASPPVHRSDLIVAFGGREILVPDSKRIDPFEIPGLGTMWPTYARDGNGNFWFEDYQSDPFTLDAFGGFSGVFVFYDPPTNDQKPLIVEAARRLLAAESSLQDQATEHVLHNYRQARVGLDDELCKEYGIPLALDEHNVWDHVTLNDRVGFTVNLSDSSVLVHPCSAYVIFEGSCTWEEEHGLLLSYLNGDRIARVSQYDGHPTNAAAFGQGSLLDVIV